MSLLVGLKIGILIVLDFEGFIFTKFSVATKSAMRLKFSWKITGKIRLSKTLVLNLYLINENEFPEILMFSALLTVAFTSEALQFSFIKFATSSVLLSFTLRKSFKMTLKCSLIFSLTKCSIILNPTTGFDISLFVTMNGTQIYFWSRKCQNELPLLLLFPFWSY